LRKRLLQFLFPAESDAWLAILRVGLGVQITFYSLSLRKDWNYLLAGMSGLINRNLAEALLSVESHFVPRLGWFVALGQHVGVQEQIVLSAAWICLLGAGCGLLIGIASRFSAILAWLVHLCAAKSGAFFAYGADNFMTIGLFYLVFSPLPDRYSLDWQLRGLRPKNPQFLGFWCRVLQVHLCVIYFFSGFTKCLGSGWWNGSSLWRALIRPPFDVIDPEILVRWKYLFPVAAIFIWGLELTYPFFVWSSKTRPIWLICICALHAAIGVTMGMYLFALIMIVLNIAAFGPDFARAEPARTTLLLQETGS
jgi:Vitamin K-dependent gamma-carboxylase